MAVLAMGSGLLVMLALHESPSCMLQLFNMLATAQVLVHEPKQRTACLTTIDDAIPCINGAPITKTQILGCEV
jgi:hypothetical protein